VPARVGADPNAPLLEVWFFTSRPDARPFDFQQWGARQETHKGALRIKRSPLVPEDKTGVRVGPYWVSGDPELMARLR
jgi:hypothetical protein